MAFGTSYFGTSPFGVDFGEPATASDGTPIMAAVFARLVLGDYVQDSNSNLTDTLDAVDEEVGFRLGTVQGSFLDDPTLGNSVARVRTLSTSSIVDIIDAVNRALEPMVTRGVIRNVSVFPEPETHSGLAWNLYSVS